MHFFYCCWTSSHVINNLFPSNRMGKAQQNLCSWIAAIYWFVNGFSWRSLWSMSGQPLKIQPQLPAQGFEQPCNNHSGFTGRNFLWGMLLSLNFIYSRPPFTSVLQYAWSWSSQLTNQIHFPSCSLSHEFSVMQDGIIQRHSVLTVALMCQQFK